MDEKGGRLDKLFQDDTHSGNDTRDTRAPTGARIMLKWGLELAEGE